jgi:hypothetical protein
VVGEDNCAYATVLSLLLFVERITFLPLCVCVCVCARFCAFQLLAHLTYCDKICCKHAIERWCSVLYHQLFEQLVLDDVSCFTVFCYFLFYWWDGIVVVGIETGIGLDSPGIESR